MDNIKVKIEKMESARELENLIQDKQLIKFDETNNTYCYILINNEYTIGIEYCNHGIDIAYQIDYKRNNVYFGIGLHLLCLDVVKGEIVFCKDLKSVFFEIITDADKNYFAIMCELDLYVYKNNIQIWEIGFRDVVTGYELVDDKYLKVLSDDSEVTFSLKDGSVI